MSLLVVTRPPGAGTSTVAAVVADRLRRSVLIEACVERVMTREGHGFRDEEAARHMHAAFAAHHVDERHRLVNHATAGAAADEIVERWDRGALRISRDQ